MPRSSQTASRQRACAVIELRQALVFAAGLGTRLRPLTETCPKPLVEIAGKPMLGWIADALEKAGVQRLVINTHWLPEQIEAYAQAHLKARFEVFLSHEPEILGTGGGLYQARQWLSEDFFIVNADILTSLDFRKFGQAHLAHGSDVSLGVNRLEAASSLLVDDEAQVVGLSRGREERIEIAPVGQPQLYNFTGIHAVKRSFLDRLSEPVESNLIEEYLKHLPAGLEVRAADLTGHFWSDIGTPAELERARAEWPRAF